MKMGLVGFMISSMMAALNVDCCCTDAHRFGPTVAQCLSPLGFKKIENHYVWAGRAFWAHYF
jgi:hypothetical protein